MAKISKKRVRESLEAQLMRMGADLDHFQDLLDKYCELHDTSRQLTADINKRGVVYQEVNSKGELIWKNNVSVKDRNAVIKQMLSILAQMKIDTEKAGHPGETDEM